MSDSSEKRTNVRGITAERWFVYEITRLCPVLTLTRLQKLRNIGAFTAQEKRRPASSPSFLSPEKLLTANSQATFSGFQFPNTTQIPNEVFDTLMSKLSSGELKVLLYICRRTFGFRKDSDSISLSQISKGITTKAGRGLDQGTGLSKRQVQRALRALEGRQVIQVERKVDETGLDEVNTYRLNVRSGDILSPPVETPVSITKQREQKIAEIPHAAHPRKTGDGQGLSDCRIKLGISEPGRLVERCH
jgi:phage replication O-like protein O